MAESTHKTLVIRIPEVRKHPNADTLGLVTIPGTSYQCVVKLGDIKEGDLAVYIQPDSIVPQTEPFKFIWENFVTEDGTVPEKRRRITVRRFRKEWSEGLLLPLRDFYFFALVDTDMGPAFWQEGDEVSDLLQITHYEPFEPEMAGETMSFKSGYPKSLKGWLTWLWYKITGDERGNRSSGPAIPTYDVEALKNHINVFKQGDLVVITEKIHGANGRFIFSRGKFHAGSRKLWKSKDSNCIWRRAAAQNPWIEEWCRANPDFALYGEVVPCQKFKDGSVFHYGAIGDEVKFFVFDIRTADKKWASYASIKELASLGDPSGEPYKHWAPVLYEGHYSEEVVRNLVDGKSTVADHIREGVVIRAYEENYEPIHGLGRKQLKAVSNTYLEKS